MAKPVSSRGSDQFVVRFPEGLRDEIKRLADRNGRSMNSEIIERLLYSLRSPYEYPQMDRESFNAIIDRLGLLENYIRATNPNWKDDPALQDVPRHQAPQEDDDDDDDENSDVPGISPRKP